MRTPTGAAGLIVAALYLTACEADNTGPGPDTGGGRSEPAALTATPAQLVFRIYAFDPGDMRTRMHQDAFPGEDISDRPEPEAVVPALRRLVADRLPSGRYRAADLLAPVAP